MRELSRRDFLKTAAAAPALASWLTPTSARAAGDKPAIVLIWLHGGYNCLFSHADACLAEGAFGVTTARVRDLGNGVVVDDETFGHLPDDVLAHTANVGVLHGYSDHENGTRVWWNQGRWGASYPLMLARAIGGSAAFRCVSFGTLIGSHPALMGVSLSIIPDVSAALLATGAEIQPGVDVPSRAPMARGLEAAYAMSRRAFERSPNMLRELYESMHVAKTALAAPASPIAWSEIATAYGLGTSMTIKDFASQCAAAELMIRGGTDVVTIQDKGEGATAGFGWDSHNDVDGASVRGMMQMRFPALRTFLSRMLSLPDRNVVVAIIGDFARSHDSGHAHGLSSTVWGKNVRGGTSGRAHIVGPDYVLDEGTPGMDPFYSFLCEAAGVQSPFGDNPHRGLLL